MVSSFLQIRIFPSTTNKEDLPMANLYQRECLRLENQKSSMGEKSETFQTLWCWGRTHRARTFVFSFGIQRTPPQSEGKSATHPRTVEYDPGTEDTDKKARPKRHKPPPALDCSNQSLIYVAIYPGPGTQLQAGRKANATQKKAQIEVRHKPLGGCSGWQ